MFRQEPPRLSSNGNSTKNLSTNDNSIVISTNSFYKKIEKKIEINNSGSENEQNENVLDNSGFLQKSPKLSNSSFTKDNDQSRKKKVERKITKNQVQSKFPTFYLSKKKTKFDFNKGVTHDIKKPKPQKPKKPSPEKKPVVEPKTPKTPKIKHKTVIQTTPKSTGRIAVNM